VEASSYIVANGKTKAKSKQLGWLHKCPFTAHRTA